MHLSARTSACLFVGLAALYAPFASASVISIPGLYSTGVDDGGDPLGNGVPETHYQLTAVPPVSDGKGGFVPSSTDFRTFRQTLLSATIPLGTPPSWSGDSTTSDWIGPRNPDLLFQPPGTYLYSTSFFLGPDVDPSTARADLYIFGDDGVMDIRLNSWDTGFTDYDRAHPTSAWVVPYHFLLDQGFLPGDNTLEFRVDNSGGPTGLRVQVISSIQQADFGGGSDIPEPGSVELLLAGLLGLGLALRWPPLSRLRIACKA